MSKKIEGPQTLTRLSVNNIKRVSAVEITPDDNVVILGGKNEQGKTSVLDSIMFAIAGKKKIPEQPVKRGSKDGSVEVETQDLLITRKFSEDGSSALTVKRKGGRKLGAPQGVLDDLTSGISFDPLKFSEMDSKKQTAEVCDLVGLDLSDIDDEYGAAYDDRAEVNKELAKAKSELQGMPVYDDAPEEETSAEEIRAEVESVRASNKEYRDLEEQRNKLRVQYDSIAQRIEQLEEELEATEAKGKEVASQLEGRELLDEDALFEKLTKVEEINAMVRANESFAAKTEEITFVEAKVARINSRMDELKGLRAKKIADSKMPIEHLSIDEKGRLVYKETLLEECSAAERLRVSVSMAMAQNPGMPVMLIRDGSLLDEDNLAMIAKMAKENGAQVWIERVSVDDEGAIIIEDGAVKS